MSGKMNWENLRRRDRQNTARREQHKSDEERDEELKRWLTPQKHGSKNLSDSRKTVVAKKSRTNGLEVMSSRLKNLEATLELMKFNVAIDEVLAATIVKCSRVIGLGGSKSNPHIEQKRLYESKVKTLKSILDNVQKTLKKVER